MRFIILLLIGCNILFSQDYVYPFAIPNPLPAQQSMARMTVPTGFKLELFASEPMVINPIDWVWDHKGRLWVAETVDYPHVIAADALNGGNDKIKILEDTNGDGRADKVTVFADKINIPAGIALAGNGLIVAATRGIYLFEDTDADDVADKKTELYGGFSTWDTHLQVNSPRYGIDNQIWLSHGLNLADVPRKDLHQTIFKFNPEEGSGGTLEKVSNLGGNIWGVGFDEFGNIFSSKANDGLKTMTPYGGSERVIQTVIPSKYYDKITTAFRGNSDIANHRRLIPDDHVIVASRSTRTPDLPSYPESSTNANISFRGSTSMNAEVYTARLFGDKYNNKAMFICEPGLRIVHQEFLTPHQSRFYTSEDVANRNIMTSSDTWTAIIRAQSGPDGALWLLDWYDFAIGHNSPLVHRGDTQQGPARATIEKRDKILGRIYRIVPETPALVDPIPSLSKDNIDGLIAALRHDNKFWRLTAQRLLVANKSQKSTIVQKILPTLLYNNRPNEIDNWGTVHALWTLDGLGAIGENSASIQPLLNHPSDAVVMTAVNLLPKVRTTVTAINDAKVLEDENPHLRLKTLLALSDIPANEVTGLILSLRDADKDLDNFSTDAFNMATSNGLAIGSANPGGSRIADLTLNVPISKPVLNKRFFSQLTVYSHSGKLTGQSFTKDDAGIIRFISHDGKVLGTRRLHNNRFEEGGFNTELGIYFYVLNNVLNEKRGKVINY